MLSDVGHKISRIYHLIHTVIILLNHQKYQDFWLLSSIMMYNISKMAIYHGCSFSYNDQPCINMDSLSRGKEVIRGHSKMTSPGKGGQQKRWLPLFQIANSIVFMVTGEGGRCVVKSFLKAPYFYQESLTFLCLPFDRWRLG